MQPKFCLVAITGDKSADGMSDTNTVYLFDDKHIDHVHEFLKAQLEYEVFMATYKIPCETESDVKKYDQVWENRFNTFDKLEEVGIFKDKWDFRTTWNFALYDEISCNKAYKPWKLVITSE